MNVAPAVFFVFFLLSVMKQDLYAILIPDDRDSLPHYALAYNLDEYGDREAYPDFQSVCRLLHGGNRFCSGVLISSYWVLTAAHCFDLNTEQFSAYNYDKPIEVGFDREGMDGGSIRHRVRYIYTHLNWLDVTAIYDNYELPEDPPEWVFGAEFCLLELDEPVTGIMPAILNAEPADLLGEVVYISGYGYQGVVGPDVIDYDTDPLSRWAAANIMDRVGPYIWGPEETYITSYFAIDLDLGPESFNALNGVPELVDFVGSSSRFMGDGFSSTEPLSLEGSVSPGDSGSPAFVKLRNEWVVAGITSFGWGDQVFATDVFEGMISLFNRVSTNLDWMLEVTGITGPSYLFRDSVKETGSWRWSSWFEYIWVEPFPWIYKYGQGWGYCYTHDAGNSLYYYDMKRGWIYTNKSIFPCIYLLENKSWDVLEGGDL